MNIYSAPDEIKDYIGGKASVAWQKMKNWMSWTQTSTDNALSVKPQEQVDLAKKAVAQPAQQTKEDQALKSEPTSSTGTPDQKQVQQKALEQVIGSGQYDMNDPAQKEQAFVTAKQLSDDMMAGFGNFSAELRKQSGVDVLTQMRDESTASYFKMVNSIGSGQALAEIEKKVDYTSDIDKTIEALKTKKATVAQDVFARMKANANGSPVNYLEAERVINSQEQTLDNQIENLKKVRDSRKQTVLDYAKGIEDSRTKSLENAKSMIEFYDKKVKEAQDAVKEGKADYKWLVDTQQKLQDAQRDYEFKARDMNIKEAELKLKFANTFGQVGDGQTQTPKYIDKVGVKDGEKGWECGRYANNQLGIPSFFQNSFEQKKSRINSSVPTPGSAFIMNTGSWTGHVGIVIEDLWNGNIKVRDSNAIKDPATGEYNKTVATRVISTKNIVGYYDPTKTVAMSTRVKDVVSERIKELKDKGASMDSIRSLINAEMKPKFWNAYEWLIAETLAENYGTDSEYVKSQNFFDNLIKLDTMGRDESEIYSEIQDMLRSNPSVVKELKLGTAGKAETQEVLAGILIDKFIEAPGGKWAGSDDQRKNNTEMFGRIKSMFPTMTDSKFKELLREKWITTAWYWYIPGLDDEEDDLFESASEWISTQKSARQ